MKIKRYKIRENVTKNDIARSCHCSWNNGAADYIIGGADFTIRKFGEFKKTDFEFSIIIAFKPNIQDWNDFNNILILDDAWCQPYTPFYDYFGKEVYDFPTLEYLISEYNKFMDSLSFLEEVKE